MRGVARVTCLVIHYAFSTCENLAVNRRECSFHGWDDYVNNITLVSLIRHIDDQRVSVRDLIGLAQTA